MKSFQKIYFLIVLFASCCFSQAKLISWNIQNLGASKSDSTITYIAKILQDYDVVALQEVVAGYGGAQAVARLADELNRMGSKWNYSISDPTVSSTYKTERYAFLYKMKSIKLIGKPWLEQKYNQLIDREPYYATFEYKNKQFTLANFHAITKSKQPETEIKYFKFLPGQYPTLNLIFLGDFNCPQSHTVFNPLKTQGYRSAFINQKTSLKKNCDYDNCLASEYDNIFYNSSKVTAKNPLPILFYKDFENFKSAKLISDHIPIAVEIYFK